MQSQTKYTDILPEKLGVILGVSNVKVNSSFHSITNTCVYGPNAEMKLILCIRNIKESGPLELRLLCYAPECFKLELCITNFGTLDVRIGECMLKVSPILRCLLVLGNDTIGPLPVKLPWKRSAHQSLAFATVVDVAPQKETITKTAHVNVYIYHFFKCCM